MRKLRQGFDFTTPKEELHQIAKEASKIRAQLAAQLEQVYTSAWNASKAQVLARELGELGGCYKQPASGKRWSIAMCTMVRNDVHLREFLVRMLLAGVSHIVLLDNNHVGIHQDHNITLMVQPFVEAGLVTHEMFTHAKGYSFLHEDDKRRRVHECFAKFGSQADWASHMDSDEAIYVSRPVAGSGGNETESIGILPAMFDDLEASRLSICALEFHWRMMYGEHKVLSNPGDLLLDTFPRMCYTSSWVKTFFKHESAVAMPPHDASCKPDTNLSRTSVDSPEFKSALPHYTAHNIHYFAKTVQEFIVKTEMSMFPSYRVLSMHYSEGSDTPSQRSCSLTPIVYDANYSSTVKRITAGLREAQAGLPDGGVQLSWPPGEQVHLDDTCLHAA